MHRVIKIGGSLLSDACFPERMNSWLAKQKPAQRTSVIVGGGQTIDAMRRLDQVHGLDSASMHWRCVRLLRFTFEITCELFPDWDSISNCQAFNRYQCDPPNSGIHLIAVDTFFLPKVDPTLPENWSTTSDAIAAHLSDRLSADQLILLKACDVPTDRSVQELAAMNVVDSGLLTLSDRLPDIQIKRLDPTKGPPADPTGPRACSGLLQ